MGLYGAPFTPEQTMTSYAFRNDPITAEIEFGVDAQTAGEELDRIRQEHGTLEPGTVVDESRPEEAPLHPAFEWHDPKAAELYREHQATNLIKQVRVVVEPRPRQELVERYELAQEEPAEAPAIDEYDPLAYELSESVGAVVQARRLVETLKLKAQRRFDRQKMIAADVAIAELKDAEDDLQNAHEALTSARRASLWEKVPA